MGQQVSGLGLKETYQLNPKHTGHAYRRARARAAGAVAGYGTTKHPHSLKAAIECDEEPKGTSRGFPDMWPLLPKVCLLPHTWQAVQLLVVASLQHRCSQQGLGEGGDGSTNICMCTPAGPWVGVDQVHLHRGDHNANEEAKHFIVTLCAEAPRLGFRGVVGASADEQVVVM